MLRAIRLVVDTGVHQKHWTRQQMVDYFHAHSTQDEPTIQAEVDRYIVMPGQALGYKIGQLKILELRERAQSTLGSRFDIRAFHDQLLGNGRGRLQAGSRPIALRARVTVAEARSRARSAPEARTLRSVRGSATSSAYRTWIGASVVTTASMTAALSSA